MMADRTTVQNEIASILFRHLQVEMCSVHEDLIDTGLLDSLKIVELLLELEQHFEIRIPLDDLEIDSFRSLATITDFLLRTMPSPAQVPVDRSTYPPLAD
jgi:acyl carrier protein